MSKRPREPRASSSLPGVASDHDEVGDEDSGGESSALKKARTFMATLACNNCRARKSRCDEGRPCRYCSVMKLECIYQTPRPTKKDQSMAVAINAIRRLEEKIENLTTTIKESNASTKPLLLDHRSPTSTVSGASPGVISGPSSSLSGPGRGSIHEAVPSPQTINTPGNTAYKASDTYEMIHLSFSQHGVSLWPAIQRILPWAFISAREPLPKEYIVEIESHRVPLPIVINCRQDEYNEHWVAELPQSVVEGLSDAYFAVFHRNTPILDKFHFFSSTLVTAMEYRFAYDIESCIVLNVLALGCLAVKAHEEGDFPLPSRSPEANDRFVRPAWYSLVHDDPPGLSFLNEGRKRFGFLMCQNDMQTAQFNMLTTMYYAQILRPIDSWTTVNRASLSLISILKRSESINFEEWEGDMFSRVFWSTLMYETIITQELNLPLSGLLEYEADMPIPKFTPCPRPKTSISGLLVDDDDSFFNFHFLAQAAHRILLTRIRHNLYSFAEKEGSPTPSITAEMHHQLEQWRTNLPPPLQFSDHDNVVNAPSPAHVIAKAMLRSRYLVAKFHIGRPFLYKALHFPAHTTDSEYDEIRNGLRGGMYWPTTMGLCAQMMSALPIKFGWCSQCFGQVLLFHAIARSPDPKLRDTLPEGWQEWVRIMMRLIEECARESPGIAKDVELLKML